MRASMRAGLAMVAAFSLVLTGCMTGAPTYVPLVDGEEIARKAYGDPSTHTLIYGFLGTTTMIMGVPGTVGVDFAQVNVELPPMVLSPGYAKNAFWIAPVPVGSVVVSFDYSFTLDGRNFISVTPGIQKSLASLSFEADKPGLRYVGGYILQSKESLYFRTTLPADFGFYPDDMVNELEALNAMLKPFKGTAWEPVILARIKELENAE